MTYKWTEDQPLFVRAMLKAGGTLFIAGPPDILDEEATFVKLANRDKEVLKKLAEQEAVLHGSQGGILRAVNAADGKTLAELKLKSLPAWDAMAAANSPHLIAIS